MATESKHLATSVDYPQYHMVKHFGVLHLCFKVPHGEQDDFDGWFSIGTFTHAEDFETVADNAAEEARCMIADLIG